MAWVLALNWAEVNDMYGAGYAGTQIPAPLSC